MSEITNRNGISAPADDLFQGDVEAGLEKTRLRLLNLGIRNRLLNFPTKPSKQFLRIIDAIPDVIFHKLRDSQELVFKPVPKPPKDSGAMTLFDDFTGATEGFPGRLPDRLPDRWSDAEVATVAPIVKRIKADEYARQLKINTAVDLTDLNLQPTVKAEHQARDFIRAPHYAEELDRILKSVSATTKTTSDETGVNTLYLIFGYLEWFEEKKSDAPHLAPLLLFPVSISNNWLDPRTSTYPFYLEYSGDEIEVNLTLRVKLKQEFGLALPDFSDEDTPETYFAKVNPIIATQLRWKVRRQITLANLSFHKLRMWQDLDPGAWPDNGLLDHALVREFFIGRQADEEFSCADYPIDDSETQAEPPPLIYDADSSQHSALIDVINGKNLVIEGPPGTGKSQTITNLIAAAMAVGKTVLFVAEKKAALDVVHSRLEKAGLDDFCLELHSNKAKTKSLAANLKQRLERRNKFGPAAALQQKKQTLEENKRQLIDYVETINTKYGGCGRTIQQIIGAREKLRHELAFDLSLIESMSAPGAEELTLAQVEMIKQRAKVYGQSLSQVLSYGGFQAHPWFGVTRLALSLAEERSLLNALQEISGAASEIEQDIESFWAEVGANDQPGEASFDELLKLETHLPTINPGLRKDLLQPLSSPALRTEMLAFGDLLKRYAETRDGLALSFGKVPELNACEIEILKNSCGQAAQLEVASMTIAELKNHAKWIESFADYLLRTSNLFNQVCRHLDCSLSFDTDSVSIITKAMVMLGEAPMQALHLRDSALERDGIGSVIAQAHEEAESLREQAEEISSRIDWNLAPARELLPQHAVVCANGGIFGFVAKDFRLARRDWRGMAKQGRWASGERMAQDYRSLIQYFDALNNFTSSHQYREALGPLFNGIKTPFYELILLAEWYESVKQKLGVGSDTARQTASALFTAPAGNLKALLEMKKTLAEEFEQMRKVFGNFQSQIARLPKAFQPYAFEKEAGADLNQLAHRLKDLSAHLQTIALMFDELNVATNLPLAAIPIQLDSALELAELQEKIQNSRTIATVLGLDSLSAEMNFAEIEEAITFTESLEKSSLAPAIRKWLLAADIELRMEHIRKVTAQLGAKFTQFQAAKEQFVALAEVDEQEWRLADIANPGFSFKQVQGKTSLALKAAPELSAWLAYLRARQSLIDLGFEPLVKLAENGAITAGDVLPGATFIYQNSLLLSASEKFPQLARFDGLAHEEARKQFASIDGEVIDLTREELAWQIDQRTIPPGNSLGSVSAYTDLGLLRYLASHPNSRIKIRQLVERAGAALMALKPCFMMSPLSVAQFLPPGSVNFDLIVMDEASQLRPEDALGAIARGAQIIVVGDRMQLPPTNFFNNIIDEAGQDDVDESLTDEAESVLDMASHRYQPTRLLKWHYRSQHESLIAFSNKEFYGDQLTVFPSPFPGSDEFGVKFKLVDGGKYDKNQNISEAESVASAVIQHLIAHPQESLGVVGLNLKQKELISELLEKRLKENKAAEKRYKDWEANGVEVFVKNLETVQGDERDVIFISATAGKNQDGRFNLTSLGALNNSKFGHRRLNVLITRARKRIVVFSSIDPAEIQTSQNNSWGIRAFRDYLAYAQTGLLHQPRDTERDPDSEFEIVVADALRKRGYEVTPQVGVASYRIDLAVRHPEKPGSYILGVECDGATYHSSRSARDRDRLRQAVLERLGWNIHRIWSTDWFRNREKEIDKVVFRITELLQIV